ncbi:MAG: hypothetical protein K8T91_09320 [Planctomycetes bacterium]|nr:hypothetical protein [Planctomycetota bacterium]
MEKEEKIPEFFSEIFRTIFCGVQDHESWVLMSAPQRRILACSNCESQLAIAFSFVFSRMIRASLFMCARRVIILHAPQCASASRAAIAAQHAPRGGSLVEKFGKFLPKGLDEKIEIIKIYIHAIAMSLRSDESKEFHLGLDESLGPLSIGRLECPECDLR